MQSKFLIIILFIVALVPHAASAHQPQVVDSSPVTVTEPEISKAYYAELRGRPDTYVIDSTSDFRLYLRVTVPASANPDGRYDVGVFRVDGVGREPVAELPFGDAPWEPFHEEFANDDYYQGPEMTTRLPAGRYEIEVSGNGERGKYALAVGDVESFSVSEIFRSVYVIPRLKRDFFGVSPLTFAVSIFGGAYLALMLAIGVVAGWAWRAVDARVAKDPVRRARHNIGNADRAIRFVLAAAVLSFALLTTWNALLLALGGFILFEAFSRWCAVYAAMGRNTCPI